MISVASYGHTLDSSVTSCGHPPRVLIARILKKKLKMRTKKIFFTIFSEQCSRPLVSIKVANGSIMQHMGTIPGRFGSAQVALARLTCDYNAISVQLQLQLPTGTELGNYDIFCVNFPFLISFFPLIFLFHSYFFILDFCND